MPQPTPPQSVRPPRTHVEAAARRMYARVLSQWALDMLSLRRVHLDQPCARGEFDASVVPPSSGSSLPWAGPRWEDGGSRRHLHWVERRAA